MNVYKAKLGLFSRSSKGTARFLGFFLILYAAQLLHIHGTLLSETLQHRGLVELLTCAKFLHHTSLLKLALKLLQSSLNVLTFFYRYYNHCFVYLIILTLVTCT